MIRKRTSSIWTLPENHFRQLIKNSNTNSEVLAFFKMSNKGGNGRTLKERIIFLNIDTSHFKKGGNGSPPIPLNEILVNNSNYQRGRLKKRLIDTGLLKNECSICSKQPVWNNLPLVMILDHINGNPKDNRIENLRLVCPDCNSQLTTFAGKKNQKLLIDNFCLDCGQKIMKQSKRCRMCALRTNKKIVVWPSNTNLLEMSKTMTNFKIAQALAVSESAVRKRLKKISASLNVELDRAPERAIIV